MCTKSEALVILGEVMERTRDIFGSSLADGYLYGSYARGDHDDESDVDILVTVDVTDEDIRAKRSALAKIDSDLSLEHDVTVLRCSKAAGAVQEVCKHISVLSECHQ